MAIDMRDTISFLYTPDGFLDFRIETGVFRDLGGWMVSDIQHYAPDCLETLAMLEDVRAGLLEREELEGNAFQVTITPDGVYAANMGMGYGTEYTFDEAHAVVLAYWKWLTPNEGDRAAQIAAWSVEFGRAHPCRDHLG